jgi:hypothetical protein
MTTNGTMPPIAAWQVASMRISAFPSEVVPTERLSWWDDIVGFPPETVVSRPKAGQYQAQGEFEGRRLALQIQPGRIEWSVSPLVKASEEDSDILVGPFPDVLASLLKVVANWLPSAPALTRVAFGAILVQPVESVGSGYALLQRYLRPAVVVDPTGSSDLFYQINRPRTSTSGIEGLRINRLSKWSVQVAQRITVTLGADGVAARNLGQDIGCRLELDVNTGQDFASKLPAERLGALLQELPDLGSEIAQKGDIP